MMRSEWAFGLIFRGVYPFSHLLLDPLQSIKSWNGVSPKMSPNFRQTIAIIRCSASLFLHGNIQQEITSGPTHTNGPFN
jgi:hypothetical protein